MDTIHAFLVRIEMPLVYLFLLRFPILCALFLVGFRWVALQLAGSGARIQDEKTLEQAVGPPLSWHLTEQQKSNIRKEWAIQSNGGESRAVATFLS
jgi:hypothetical protein